MKKILTILLCLFSVVGFSQTYNPTQATVSNKPYGPSQAIPTDSRSMFFDGVNFLWRPYQNITEVKSYLNLSKYRAGNFIIIVDSGGVLQGNGTYSGGVNNFWMFKDGTADGNLVELNFTGGGGGGGSGTLTNLTSTAGGGITLGISNPTTTPNITPSVTLGGDISGSTLSAVTVAKFNGQLPSFYLNYNNLTNTPTIPAQFNPIAGNNITLSGIYPNITFNATAGVTTAGVDLLLTGGGTTLGIDTLHYRKQDTTYGINDSTLVITINSRPDTIVVKGGVHGGGGGGSGVTSFSFTNANGVSGVVSNPTSTPNLTLTLGAITPTTVNALTLLQVANGFTITGGTGTPHTLTVTANANVSGTNTGDVTLAGENYLSIVNQVITANPVNVSGTNITGTLKAAAEPAHTGDVTNSAGSLSMSISPGVVTNSKLANMPNNTVKGNVSGISNPPSDLTTTQLTTLVNTFTTTLNGSVPAPTSVAGKVLSDNGTWVQNGTGNTNTNVGAGFRWAVPGGNTIKTAFAGFGVLIDSTSNSNGLTFKVDTTKIAQVGADSIFVKNIPSTAGGFPILSVSVVVRDTVYGKQLYAGANITLDTTTNPNGITITSTGGGGGGITTVGAFDSQAKSTNGAVISGASIFFQSEDATHPGMLNNVAQVISGAKTFSSAPTFSTLTTNGGVFWGNASGVLLQSNSGTATQVLHGGTAPSSPPSFSSIVLSTDVSGILPILNGGNGTATPTITAGAGISISGTWNNYTISNSTLGTVTSINISGGTTGAVFSGGPVTTSGTITMSGTLVPTNGGTGLSSLTPYAILAGGSTATGTLQQVSGVGTTGQVLTSNGPNQLPSFQNVTASGSVALDGTQIYTSGTTVTVSNGNNVLYVDPSSVQSTLTITLPTVPHNSNLVWIHFGGIITSGSVITTLVIAGNPVQAATPTTANAGEVLGYRWRASTSQWYRFL